MATVALRYTGPLTGLGEARTQLLQRGRAGLADARRAVEPMAAQVRADGDAALRELTQRFDGARLDALEVPRATWKKAAAKVAPEDRAPLRRAAHRIRAYHLQQRPRAWRTRIDGITLGWTPVPIDRVGVYVPGGAATYPSTLLMGAIPARIANVREVVVCTPPRRDGSLHPMVLAAALEAKVDAVYRVGGAQAVFGMAYGTPSIARVDKIVGPGNVYVQAAKQLVHEQGEVGIDLLAGPSEVLVIADASADPELVALEMAAQAEHDPNACSVVVAMNARLARRIEGALAEVVPKLARAATIERSLAANGALLTARTLAEALEFANAFAAEHLVLMVRDPHAALRSVRHAGSVFLGARSPVAMGDYGAGTNHILPTAGSARFSAGLSVLDFVKGVQWQEAGPEGVRRVAPDVARLGDLEGLQAHAEAARARLRRLKEP